MSILPDNYFSLLTGESRTVKAIVPKAELEAQEPRLRGLGWKDSLDATRERQAVRYERCH
jgi:hypothetical protein